MYHEQAIDMFLRALEIKPEYTPQELQIHAMIADTVNTYVKDRNNGVMKSNANPPRVVNIAVGSSTQKSQDGIYRVVNTLWSYYCNS